MQRTWVVLPDPVSPTMMSTLCLAMASRRDSRYGYIGSDRRSACNFSNALCLATSRALSSACAGSSSSSTSTPVRSQGQT